MFWIKTMSDVKEKIAKGDNLLIMVGLISLFTLFLFWTRFHTEIVYLSVLFGGVFAAPFYLIHSFLNLIGIERTPIITDAALITLKVCDPSFLFFNCKNDLSKVSLFELISSIVVLNFVWFFVCLPFIIKSSKRFIDEHPAKGFNKTMGMEEFIKEQEVNHSHLKVFGRINFSNYDMKKGFFKGLDSTQEFADRYGLIKDVRKRLISISIGGIHKEYEDKEELVPVIDEKKLIAIMKYQLGDLCNISKKELEDGCEIGDSFINSLGKEELILYALYLPVACATDEEMDDIEYNQIISGSKELIEYYWDVASTHICNNPLFLKENQYNQENRDLIGFDFDFLKRKISKYINHEISRNILKKHSYVRTALCEIIITAKENGVMPPTDIRWIKLYNRSIYALIQNIGRPSLFSEGMGAISHYLVEKKIGKALEEPDFNIAIIGYNSGLLSFAMAKSRKNAADSKKSLLNSVASGSNTPEKYKSNVDHESDFLYGDNGPDVNFNQQVEISYEEIQRVKKDFMN